MFRRMDSGNKASILDCGRKRERRIVDTVVSDHFEMFVGDMDNETLKKFNGGNSFYNEFVIFVPVVMKADNMPYNEETDCFTCPAGNQLRFTGTKNVKSKSGFISEVSVYHCIACADCPLRSQCTKSKSGRTIQRSKAFRAYRTQSQDRITSEFGTLLRMNRSIQSEGKFGVLKENWGFRRFLRRGMQNVFTEVLLYAFALNIKKLNSKIQKQIQGVILHHLEAS